MKKGSWEKNAKGIFLAATLIVVCFAFNIDSAYGASLEEESSFQVKELKTNLASLEQVRSLEKTDENMEREKVIRQKALFRIIEISLMENSKMLEFVSSLDLENKDIVEGVKDILEEDNNNYEDFIEKINLASSSQDLKDLAKQIKFYRQNEDGLIIRRILGLLLSLRELESIQFAKEESDSIYKKLEEEELLKDGLLRVQLLAANNELDTAYQLTISSQLRLQEMKNFEDFNFVGDWLERANHSINIAYKILKEAKMGI